MISQKGICYDFAHLFAAFCRSQNIPCYVVDGTKIDDANYHHTWNRVYFNDFCFATSEAIAHIMTQKFVIGSPLYRQEQEINRKGIKLSRQTMSNWLLKATEDYLAPVYEQFHKELLARDVLHGDETTLLVLHEPGKKPQSDSYMWLYQISGDTDRPIVLYEYQPARGTKHPKEFLDGYKGYLHADGYAGYHDLRNDITVVGCWAHARKRFDEAVRSLPKGKAKGSSASQGLAYCNLLFAIEQRLAEKDATAEE